MSMFSRLKALDEYSGGYDSENMRKAFRNGAHHAVEIIADEVSRDDENEIKTKSFQNAQPHKDKISDYKVQAFDKDYKDIIQKETTRPLSPTKTTDIQHVDIIKDLQEKQKTDPSREWVSVSERIPPYLTWVNCLIKHRIDDANKDIYIVTTAFMTEDDYMKWLSTGNAPNSLRGTEYWCNIIPFPQETIDTL